MIPTWVIIISAVIAGFILLLIVNGLRQSNNIDEEPAQTADQASDKASNKAAETEPLPMKSEEKDNKPVFRPAYQREIVEEASYVESDDGTISGDFYTEVAELFLQVLDDHPERQDIRIKLLEVYFDSGNKAGFLREAKNFQKSISSKKDPEWQNILDMGKSLLPENALFGGSKKSGVNDIESTIIDSSKVTTRRFGDSKEAREVLEKLSEEYMQLRKSPEFYARLDLELLKNSGRPAPWLHARRITEKTQGAQVFVKREDLNGGQPRLRAHLMGQAWIAKQLKKEKTIFAAANGDEAVIAARAAACAGLKSLIYISANDGKYRESHKFQVQLMGSEFVETLPGDESGDIRYAALKTWISSHESSFMMLNLLAGPHPYGIIANDLQSVIGRECIRQVKGKLGKYPKAIFARGEGFADAIGFIEPFLSIKETEIHLVSPEIKQSELKSKLDSEEDLYQLLITDSQKLTANAYIGGLEYPRVNREHSIFKATERVQYDTVSIDDAKASIKAMAKAEGVIFPMNTAHVLSHALKYASQLPSDESIIVMLAERLDHDLLLVGENHF